MDREAEKERIVQAIDAAGGNISRAADLLGSSRRTLTNRMREYGMPHGKSGRRRQLLPYARRGRFSGASVATAAVGAAAVVGAVLGLVTGGKSA